MRLTSNIPFRSPVCALCFLLFISTRLFSQTGTPAATTEREIVAIANTFLTTVQLPKSKPCSAISGLPIEEALKEALLCDRRGDPHCCKSVLDRIFKNRLSLPALQACHACLALAEYFTLHQSYDSAKQLAAMANAAASERGWKNEKAEALLILSTSDLRRRNISAAYAWADSSLAIARQTGNEILEGQALLQVALCARRHFTAIAKRSLPYFLMAREKAIATGDSLTLGTIDLYVGTDNFEVGKWEEGLPYMQEGISLSLRNGDCYQLFLAYTALGYTSQLRNRPREAVTMFSKALKLAEHQGHPYGIQHCYHDLARSYRDLHQLDSALAYANLAATVPGVDSFWANVWDTKAAIYEDMGDHKTATAMYKKSLDWYREDFLYRNQDQLSGYEATLKTKEKDLQVKLQKKHALQLEWMIAATGGLLIILAVAFALQRKAQRKLVLQNNLIQKQRSALERSLSEKEVLLKEIHHRVKNSLSVISSLLELQSNGMEEETAKAAIAVGQNRVSSIALIHQRLYQHEDLAAIELNGFLEDLIRQVSGFFKKPGLQVKIEMNVPETLLDIDTAVPLGLILNELLTNSYKYAFKANKEALLEIGLQQPAPGDFVLSYADNGPGIAEEKYRAGTSSLGLRLVHRLSKQLGGDATYHYSNGSRFIIRFKNTANRNLEA